MSKKRFFVIAMLLVAMVTPLFAAATGTTGAGSTDDGMDFIQTVFGKVLVFVIGILGGGFLLVKGGIDVFHAVRTQSDDPNAMRKAVIQLIFGVIFLGGYLLIATYVLPSSVGSGDSASNVFLQNISAVSSALVN